MVSMPLVPLRPSGKPLPHRASSDEQYPLTSRHSYGVPTIVLGFLGVESIAVAAFEARSHKDIVYPALWVHWIIYAMYFFVTIGIVVSVWWKNLDLASIFGNTIHGRNLNAVNATSSLPSNNTSSPTILAMESVNSNLAGFVNACLIFSVISAGNSAVYYSSRTLWGLTYNLQGRSRISRWFKKLSPLMASSGTPIRTIFFTWLLFFWIPWLQLVPSNARVSVDESSCIADTLLKPP